jgi:trk system potassium uptake protein TrkA
VAHSVFNVPARIARLRARDFLDSETAARPRTFAVDYALCPEQVITEYIARLIDFPEALQVLSFAGGRLALVGLRAYAGGLLVGSPISEMRNHLPPEIDGRIAAIYRRDGERSRRPARRSSPTVTKSSSSLPTNTSGP